MFGSRKDLAVPGNIDRITPEDLASMIQTVGFKAKIEENHQGVKIIRSTSNGWNTSICLFDVNNNECTAIQFALWLTDQDRTVSLAKINDFNSNWRYAKAGIDTSDNSICLRMDVSLKGGVSSAYIDHMIVLWDNLVSAFRGFMAEK
jgi:hypothetical protein